MRFGKHGEFALATYGLDIPKPIERMLLKGEHEKALEINIGAKRFLRDDEEVMKAAGKTRDAKPLLQICADCGGDIPGKRIVRFSPLFKQYTPNALTATNHLSDELLEKAAGEVKKVPLEHRAGLFTAIATRGSKKAWKKYKKLSENEKPFVYGVLDASEKLLGIFRKAQINPERWEELSNTYHHSKPAQKRFILANLKAITELPHNQNEIFVLPAYLGIIQKIGIEKVKHFLQKLPVQNKISALTFLKAHPEEIDNEELLEAVKRHDISLLDEHDLEAVAKVLRSQHREKLPWLAELSKKHGSNGFRFRHIWDAYEENEEAAEDKIKRFDAHRYASEKYSRKGKKVDFPIEMRINQNKTTYTIAHATHGSAIGWIRINGHANRLFVNNIQPSGHKLPTKLRRETDNWHEEAIAIAEEEAVKRGLKTVVINSPHEIIEGSRSLGIHPDTLKRFYYDLPKKMGYELDYLPERKGFYWVKHLQ